MIPSFSVACTLLLAAAVLGHQTKVDNVPVNEVSPESIEPISKDGAEVSAIEGMVYPEEVLEGEIDLTPEEAQLRRVRLGAMFRRFPRSRWPRRRVIFPRTERAKTVVNVGKVIVNRPVLDEVLAEDAIAVDEASDIGPDDEIAIDAFPSTKSKGKKSGAKKSGGKKKGGKKSGDKPKVEKCSEGKLATIADVKEALVGDCADFQGKKVLRNKSAHNCKGKLYQCNGRCGKPGNFPGVETGVCIV